MDKRLRRLYTICVSIVICTFLQASCMKGSTANFDMEGYAISFEATDQGIADISKPQAISDNEGGYS